MSRRIFSVLLAASAILLTFSIGVTLLILYSPATALTMPSFFSSLFIFTQAITPYLLFATGIVGMLIALRQREWRWVSVFALTLLIFIALPLIFSLALGGEAGSVSLEQRWSVLTYETVVEVIWYGAALPLVFCAWRFLVSHRQPRTQPVRHATN